MTLAADARLAGRSGNGLACAKRGAAKAGRVKGKSTMTTMAPTLWQRRMRAFQNGLHRNDPHGNTMELFIVYPDDFFKLIFSSNAQDIAIIQCLAWMKAVHETKPPPSKLIQGRRETVE